MSQRDCKDRKIPPLWLLYMISIEAKSVKAVAFCIVHRSITPVFSISCENRGA
ncbi:hypothetical protein U1Q18_000897 [Sarracenia purpurea var. burkii]